MNTWGWEEQFFPPSCECLWPGPNLEWKAWGHMACRPCRRV